MPKSGLTSDIRVELPVQCDRTGRMYTLKLSLEEAKKRQRELLQKQENASKINAFIRTLEGPLPDLAVLYRNKLSILNTVVPRAERGMFRLLQELTRSTLFPKREPRARAKPNSKRGKREYASPAVVTEESSLMEKFGVDESPRPSEKLGQSIDECPLCGATCQRHGRVVLCPEHGSKPFENTSNANEAK